MICGILVNTQTDTHRKTSFTLVVTVVAVVRHTVKPIFFACPLFRKFREPGKFAKITGRDNLNTVAFQCSRKQKRQNYGVQNN